MIELGPDDRVVGAWFVCGNGVPKDWMGTVWQKKGEDGYRFAYRFRYYRDDKTFDSDDEKSWWRGSIPADKAADATTHFADVAERVAKHWACEYALPVTVDHVEGGTVEEFMERLSKRPWANSKQVPEAEAKKYVERS